MRRWCQPWGGSHSKGSYNGEFMLCQTPRSQSGASNTSRVLGCLSFSSFFSLFPVIAAGGDKWEHQRTARTRSLPTTAHIAQQSRVGWVQENGKSKWSFAAEKPLKLLLTKCVERRCKVMSTSEKLDFSSLFLLLWSATRPCCMVEKPNHENGRSSTRITVSFLKSLAFRTSFFLLLH